MNKKAKELMIPLADYPTVSKDATLSEAVMALEKAHEVLADRPYKPRSVIVVDDDGKVLGRLSLWDCLRALEPKYKDIADFSRLTHFGINPEFMRSMVEKHGLWLDPLATLCQRAAGLHVHDFMSPADESMFMDHEASLAEAIHTMVMGRFMGLFVTDGQKVVGFLRLCDLFDHVARNMKGCQI